MRLALRSSNVHYTLDAIANDTVRLPTPYFTFSDWASQSISKASNGIPTVHVKHRHVGSGGSCTECFIESEDHRLNLGRSIRTIGGLLNKLVVM